MDDIETLDMNNNHNNSMLELYGEDLITKTYITNPALEREESIKKMILALLIPDKSVIIVGKPGIGKTALVEGLAYKMQQNEIPEALKKFKIIKVNIASLLGSTTTAGGNIDSKIQLLIEELKTVENVILFIDEIHNVIGTGKENGSSLDLANMLKTGLDRGSIKIIGATTIDEFERYINKDRAFLRRFEKIELSEPNLEETVKILMGTLPKIEQQTGVKLAYTDFIITRIITFLVNMTSEYKRIYEASARYPDIAFALLNKAFSFAIYDNKQTVGFKHIWEAIKACESVYPDVLYKEKAAFRKEFAVNIQEEHVNTNEY